MVPSVAHSAGNRVAMLCHAARSVALLAVGLENNGRNVAVVRVVPVWLYHKAISPVLICVEERIFGPQRVHDLPDSLVLAESLILSKALILLSETLVLILTPLVWLRISPLISLIGLCVSPLIGLVLVVSPLIWLIVSPLIRLVLLGVAPLIGLVVSPLVWLIISPLIGLVGLIGLGVSPLIGLVVAPLPLSLSLLVPHVIFYCKDM